MTLSAAELFRFADRQRDAGHFAIAEAAYRALTSNPDIELRTEARFRLAMMLADLEHKPREAAVELRRILDEKPKAARVRLELARLQAQLGNVGAAEREFRAAEAAGLPPEVEQLVRFYANALNARKPLGGSFEVTLARDSNVNRATRSNTLGTVIGDFVLDQDAKAHSGLGLAVRGQAYGRAPLNEHANLLATVSASGSLYRQSEFDDIVAGVQLGRELSLGRDRLTIGAGPTWRWYGMDLYTVSYGGNATWQHPLGKRAQLRTDAAVNRTDNRRNDLQDETSYSLAASFDRAFSARLGGGLQLQGAREVARDPGYSTASAGLTAYAFREIGHTTAVVTVGYSHLEADRRLLLYPQRRRDDHFSASFAATFRALRLGTFAPLARLRWERNNSTVGLYAYSRVAGEVGLTTAF